MKGNPVLNKINFYQLDNLINNRVPFIFYNMSESITAWYSSVSKLHVQTYEKLITAEQVVEDLSRNKAPKDYAIVLLCKDGTDSLKLYSELEKMAYTNVYVVDGGYQQLMTERS